MAKYDAMVKLRKDERQANEEKAIQAINSLIKKKEKITCKKIADMIGIDRRSLYRYTTVISVINQYNERPSIFRSGDSTATLLKLEESKSKNLESKCKKLESLMETDAKYKEQCQSLKEKVKELEELLAEKDGEGW